MSRFLAIALAAIAFIAGSSLMATTEPASAAKAEQGVEFDANLKWFNVEKPLALADLKGRVVILEIGRAHV